MHSSFRRETRPLPRIALPSPESARAAHLPELRACTAKLVLIRGLPGSGKSTMAKELAANGYLHFEADMYFMVDGAYQYDATQIREAHAWCQCMTRDALAKGQRVVVSNTFTRLQEMAPYRTMAASVQVIEARGSWQNTHGVPPETLHKMAQRWERLTQ